MQPSYPYYPPYAQPQPVPSQPPQGQVSGLVLASHPQLCELRLIACLTVQMQQKSMLVFIPKNAQPGQLITVKSLEGVDVSYTVPPGAAAGQSLQVSYFA
jgi:hypothetical protein